MKNVKLVIGKAQKQDQKAFNELFNYHWSYLYNFQLKKTGNKDLAEEISIITFTSSGAFSPTEILLISILFLYLI